MLSEEGVKAVISVEEFCQAYRAQPDEAMASLKGLDDEKTAALLIDAGGVLSEASLLDDGISRLEELRRSESETSFQSYCIANGRHLRASLARRVSSPIDDNMLRACCS